MQGRLAQMDRVQASEAWGRGFESHAARQIDKKGAVAPFFALHDKLSRLAASWLGSGSDFPAH
jgi:hypothetical protein